MSKCECKECLHYDVCLYKSCVGECPLNKSKSLFVELPCRCKDCEFFAIEKIDDNEEYICKHRGGMIGIIKQRMNYIRVKPNLPPMEENK